MTTPCAPAHSPFGGSGATRILHCPASVGLVAKVPAHLRKTSSYAARGTACHSAMALLIEQQQQRIDDLVGETFNDYTVTIDDVETALRPVLAHVEALLDLPGAEYYLEHRVVFPTIAGAFGTADLIVRIGSTIRIVDFKFGSGVRVLALYPDGDEDVLNAQLLFYAAAARHSLPEFFAGVDDIVLTILQPQSIEPDATMESSVEVTHDELDAFIAIYRAACEEALSPSPRLKKGPHCRFCAARPICPAHTAPIFDLAEFTVPTPATQPSKESYLRALAAGLVLVDAITDVRTALRDQAKAALENGDSVPGYALTAGRAARHWRDDERTTIAALERLGLSREDIIAEAMRSVKQIELRARARSLRIPPQLIVSRRSGVSLARIENARALVPGRDALVKSFAVALQALKEGNTYG